MNSSLSTYYTHFYLSFIKNFPNSIFKKPLKIPKGMALGSIALSPAICHKSNQSFFNIGIIAS